MVNFDALTQWTSYLQMLSNDVGISYFDFDPFIIPNITEANGEPLQTTDIESNIGSNTAIHVYRENDAVLCEPQRKTGFSPELCWRSRRPRMWAASSPRRWCGTVKPDRETLEPNATETLPHHWDNNNPSESYPSTGICSLISKHSLSSLDSCSTTRETITIILYII